MDKVRSSSRADDRINGNSLPASTFIAITSQYRSATTGTILSIQDLNAVPVDASGRTGIIAQFTTYETTDKASGAKTKAVATTIVAVEEREGRRVIAGIWEAQSEVQGQ